jgi:hypothetical protein
MYEFSDAESVGYTIREPIRVVSHGRYVTVQMAAVAASRPMLADIFSLIARLRAPSAPA